MEAGHITQPGFAGIKLGLGFVSFEECFLPLSPPQTWLIYNGTALCLCLADPLSLEMKRFTLDVVLEKWNSLQITKYLFKNLYSMPTQTLLGWMNWLVLYSKSPALGAMINSAFPRSIQLPLGARTAEVNDLARKNCSAINQERLGRNTLPAVPVLSPLFSLPTVCLNKLGRWMDSFDYKGIELAH